MNDISIGFSIPVWLAILIIIAGFAFAWWSYQRTVPPVSSPRRWTLILLRTTGITLLLLALFELLVSSTAIKTEAPQIVAGLDNSESMSLRGIDTSRISEAKEGMKMLFASRFQDDLLSLSFSDSAQPFLPSSLDSVAIAKGVETNLSRPFDLLSDSIHRRNIGALVLFTDGRYNSGPNPAFDAERLGVPVFAVGLGDSVEPRDLILDQLFTNEIAYINHRTTSTGSPSLIRVQSTSSRACAA